MLTGEEHRYGGVYDNLLQWGCVVGSIRWGLSRGGPEPGLMLGGEIPPICGTRDIYGLVRERLCHELPIPASIGVSFVSCGKSVQSLQRFN